MIGGGGGFVIEHMIKSREKTKILSSSNWLMLLFVVAFMILPCRRSSDTGLKLFPRGILKKPSTNKLLEQLQRWL